MQDHAQLLLKILTGFTGFIFIKSTRLTKGTFNFVSKNTSYHQRLLNRQFRQSGTLFCIKKLSNKIDEYLNKLL